MDTANVRVPVLARLILNEVAERRGQNAGALLAELIFREAVAELNTSASVQRKSTPATAESIDASR